ncbi:hypothetical protein H7Y63_03045 [Polaromonas sp.]|nr:hypothetical protein [Candidatus Saccharibacteria bacterium]
MEHSGHSDKEYGRLADLSAQLEDLPHASNGYALLLQDSMMRNRVAATCGEITLFTSELPPEMVEAHYFPARFTMSNFKAEVNQTKDADTGDVSWFFSASYQANSNNYRFTADEKESILATESNEGTELHYTFKPEIAGRFLAGIALGILRCGEAFDPQESFDVATPYSVQLIHFLYLIGASYGHYGAQTTSFIEEAEQDRSLMITSHLLENRTGTSEEHSYRLVFKVGESMLADESSQQAVSISGGKILTTRFAERQPGYTEPQDLPFSDLLRTADEDSGVLFEPSIDPEEYMRVNATIMVFIARCLLDPRYRQVDLMPSIEELVDDEELTALYFRDLNNEE